MLGPLLGVVAAERLLEHGRHALRDRAHRSPEVARSRASIHHVPTSDVLREKSGATKDASRTTPTIAERPVRIARLPNSSGNTMTAPVATIHSSPNGMSTFQPKFIRRSYRMRGSVARTRT